MKLLLEAAEIVLAAAQKKEIEATEVAINQEVGFSVTARLGDVETLEQQQNKSLVVTVYHQQKTGSASTSDLSQHAIISAVEKAYAIAQYSGEDPYSGLADKDRLAFQYPDLNLSHPWRIAPADAIQMAIECERVARESDKRIVTSEGASISTYEYSRVYANSQGFVGNYAVSEHGIQCGVVAAESENGLMQREFEYSISRKPELLDDLAYIGRRTAEKALSRLGARKIKTQRCPVIYQAPAAKSLISAFVSAASGQNLYRESSFLLNALKQQIFPKHIDIYQQPHLLNGLGSAPFDSEGVITQNRHYIEEGHLVSYFLGSYSARKLKLATTGNAGGVFNLTVSNSDLNLAQLLKQMDTGLLVTDLMGRGANILTGDYSRGASGFWVENGEIQFPVEEITIAGNLKDMFSHLVSVADDVDTRSSIRTGSILLESMMIGGE